MKHDAPLETLRVRTFDIPTATPESDGTLEWTRTTLVLVQPQAAGRQGLGYTYADRATADLIHDTLSPLVCGMDVLDIPAIRAAMLREIRNLGRPGVCAMAISAVDNALWDLKARILGLPLARLLGCVRSGVAVYGSGGFTSYTDPELARHMEHWIAQGVKNVKIKVGTEPARDPARVRVARKAIGNDAGLFVDANGAYSVKQALLLAGIFAEEGVSWFEEPVSSDDLEGLRRVRERAPASIEVAAGEYGYNPEYFLTMLGSGAIDVVQVDATRCLGVSGFLEAAAFADAFHIPLSSHCAPSLHLHLGCATVRFRHLEYFFDHVRIEKMLFDGFREPVEGVLHPDLTAEGTGLVFKERDALKFAA